MGADALVANCQGTLLMNFYAGGTVGQRSTRGQRAKLPGAASSPPHRLMQSTAVRASGLLAVRRKDVSNGEMLMPFNLLEAVETTCRAAIYIISCPFWRASFLNGSQKRLMASSAVTLSAVSLPCFLVGLNPESSSP